MFIFALLCERNVTQYCYRVDKESLPQCEPKDIVVKSVDEFYDTIKEKQMVNLRIINDESTIVDISSAKLKNAEIDFSGISTTKINFQLVNQTECSLDAIGFKNISVKMDSHDYITFRHIFMVGVEFDFSKNVTLRAHKIHSDLRSVSFFNIANTTEFHLTSAEGLPHSNTRIIVSTILEVEAQHEDSRVTIGIDDLEMKFGDTVIYFEMKNYTQVTINHNSKGVRMVIDVINVEYNKSTDSVYSLNVANGALVDLTYQDFYEVSAPSVRTYLNTGAVLSVANQNSQASIFINGTAILDLQNRLNECGFSDITILENGTLTLQNSKTISKINLFNYLAVHANGVINASNPVTIRVPKVELHGNSKEDNFLQNIKLADVQVFKTTNSEAYIPSINFAKESKFIYHYDMETRKYVSFGEMNFNNRAAMYFTGSSTPTNEEAKYFVDSPQYTFCTKNEYSCDQWKIIAESQGITGLTAETSILKPVCKKVDSMTCAGFQFIDTPLQVYPKICYADNDYECIGSLFVNKDNATALSSLISKNTRQIDATVMDNMDSNTYFAFAGLQNTIAVKVKGLLRDITINLKIDPNERHISALKMENGIFDFVENEIKLDYIEFGLLSSLSDHAKSTLKFSDKTVVGVSLQVLGELDIKSFPNAVIPIYSNVHITYTELGWIFMDDFEYNISAKDYSLPLYIDRTGVVTLIPQYNETIHTLKLMAAKGLNTYHVHIRDGFKSGQNAIEFYDDAKALIYTKCSILPFSFYGNLNSFEIIEGPESGAAFELEDLNLTDTKFAIEIVDPTFIVKINKITAQGKVSVSGPVFVKDFEVAAKHSSIFLDGTNVQNRELIMPIGTTLFAKNAKLPNRVNLTAQPGYLTTLTVEDDASHLPSVVEIDWTCDHVDDNGMKISSPVLSCRLDKKALTDIARLKKTSMQVGKRTVNAALQIEDRSVTIVYSSDASKSKMLAVICITGAVVAVIALIIGVLAYFACCRKHMIRDMKLLSASQLLLSNSGV